MRLEARPTRATQNNARAPKKAPVPLRPHRATPPAATGEIAHLQRPPIAASASAPIVGAAVAHNSAPVGVTQPDPIRVPAAPQVLRPAGQATSVPLARQPYYRANNQELSNFFRQLAALMHAGTGIGSALKTLAEHGGGSGLRKASGQMAERAMTGEPFSESMKAYPGLFTPLMVGIVSAGERGGFMENSFHPARRLLRARLQARPKHQTGDLVSQNHLLFLLCHRRFSDAVSPRFSGVFPGSLRALFDYGADHFRLERLEICQTGAGIGRHRAAPVWGALRPPKSTTRSN